MLKIRTVKKLVSNHINEYVQKDKRKLYEQLIKDYLTSHSVRKLQLGSGYNLLPGWLNTDIYSPSPEIVLLDVREPFPIQEQSLDYILSEHHIEHLTYLEGLAMLRECYRVLKPGGKVRIATPDLAVLIQLYTAQPKNDAQQKYIQFMIDNFMPDIGIYHESFVINNAFQNWGHKFLYDRPTLEQLMAKVGFVQLTPYKPGESDDVNFCGVEGRVKSNISEINFFETMVLEGTRP